MKNWKTSKFTIISNISTSLLALAIASGVFIGCGESKQSSVTSPAPTKLTNKTTPNSLTTASISAYETKIDKLLVWEKGMSPDDWTMMDAIKTAFANNLTGKNLSKDEELAVKYMVVRWVLNLDDPLWIIDNVDKIFTNSKNWLDDILDKTKKESNKEFRRLTREKANAAAHITWDTLK